MNSQMKPVVLSLLGALLLAAPATLAQSSVSSFTIPVSGTIAAQVASSTSAVSGASEAVAFSGQVIVTATVVTDPVLPPGVVLSIDGRNVTGIGQTTKAVYKNECLANLSRLFSATDTVQVHFAFFKDAGNSQLAARNAVINLNLAYNTTTMALSSVDGNFATPTLTATKTATPVASPVTPVAAAAKL